MVADFSGENPGSPLGPMLLRAWNGYRRRIEQKLTAAGFADEPLPNALVLRLCATDEKMTVSRIGRELEISRQGASKQVAALCERGYVTTEKSPGDSREKTVCLTPRAQEFLKAVDEARREVDAEIRAELGDEPLLALSALLTLLDEPGETPLWREIRTRAAAFSLTVR